jgi:hypothetical protein
VGGRGGAPAAVMTGGCGLVAGERNPHSGAEANIEGAFALMDEIPWRALFRAVRDRQGDACPLPMAAGVMPHEL